MEPGMIFFAVLVGVAALSAMGYSLYPVFFPKVCQLSDSQKEIYELTSEEDSTDYAFRCKAGFRGNPTDISFECSDDKDDTYFTSIRGCEQDCTLSDQQSAKYEMQDGEISCKDGYVQEGDEITPSCANGSYTFPAGFGCVIEGGGGEAEPCTLSEQQSTKYEIQDGEISCKDGYVQESVDGPTPSCANGLYTFPAGFGCVIEGGAGDDDPCTDDADWLNSLEEEYGGNITCRYILTVLQRDHPTDDLCVNSWFYDRNLASYCPSECNPECIQGV